MRHFRGTASISLPAAIILGIAMLFVPSCVHSQTGGPLLQEQASLEKTLGWSDFASGRLLLVSCPVRAAICVDGVGVGFAPLLLELSPGEHLLEVVGNNVIDRRRLLVSSETGSLSRLEAVMAPYRGLLDISCNMEGAIITIDGMESGITPAKAFLLSEGSHSIRITAVGQVPFEREVLIPRDRSLAVNATLDAGYPLRFKSALPAGTIIQVLGQGDSLVRAFDLCKPPLLVAGLTRFRLMFPTGGSLDFSWDPSSSAPANVSILGTLRLGSLPEGTIAEVDGKVLPIGETKGEISLMPGMHTLTVRRIGYIPTMFWCDLQPGGDYSPSIVFIRDPLIEAQKRKLIGLPLFLSGATMALGGVVFNADDMAISLSSDYQSYKLIKYASLGLIGGGLLTLFSGFGVAFFPL